MDDDEPLRGEFLRLVCAALSRNAIRGMNNTPIVLASVQDEKPVLRKSPKSEQQPKPVAGEERRFHHVLATRR
jgi:hypothetical protein